MSWLHIYPRECAMHGAVEFRTRWGYVTLKPPIYSYGQWRPWGICVSPDATPMKATFLAGPAHSEFTRRRTLGRPI